MKKGTRYIQSEKRKAHEYAMLMFNEEPTISCRAIKQRLKNMGYNIDHSTVFRWLKKA